MEETWRDRVGVLMCEVWAKATPVLVRQMAQMANHTARFLLQSSS